MQPEEIELDPELQGKGQRYCCLADQIEFKALIGEETYSKHDLADLISDSDWCRILSPRYDPIEQNDIDEDECDESLGKAQDKALEQANRVLSIHAQRAAILGDIYPFFIDSNAKLTLTSENGAYIWLTSLSLLHGFRICTTDFSVTAEFEKTVTIALKRLGLQAFTTGTASKSGKLKKTLAALQKELPSLIPTPEKVVFPNGSNDEGADNIGMFRFENDSRPGHWVFIGQSTLANSDDWSKKISEVKSRWWEDALADRVVVVPFFATPYHAEDINLEYHFRRERRCVLDRIRLTQILEGQEADFSRSLKIVRSLKPV